MGIVLAREQTEAFLKAWDNYLMDIKTVFFSESPPGKNGLSGSPSKKFSSLKEVDRRFNSYVKPILERFFGRNPSIHRHRGEPEDLEIYHKYADRCPYLLKPYRIGKREAAAPRVRMNVPIESKQDIWLLIEGYPVIGRDLAELMEELVAQWRDYQDLILVLSERDEAVQAEPETKSEILKPHKLRLVRNGSMAYWGDQFLPLKGKRFDMLCKLAQNTGNTVMHQDLYSLINSQHHQDLLLRQYINDIRKAFPPPYCDSHHPEGIIKTRKMEGYYLDLPSERVEIV